MSFNFKPQLSTNPAASAGAGYPNYQIFNPTSAQLLSTAGMDINCGFNIASFVIDNPSSMWLCIRPNNIYIPPFTTQFVYSPIPTIFNCNIVALPNGMSNPLTPVSSPTAIAGKLPTITCYDQFLGYSGGIKYADGWPASQYSNTAAISLALNATSGSISSLGPTPANATYRIFSIGIQWLPVAGVAPNHNLAVYAAATGAGAQSFLGYMNLNSGAAGVKHADSISFWPNGVLLAAAQVVTFFYYRTDGTTAASTVTAVATIGYSTL